MLGAYAWKYGSGERGCCWKQRSSKEVALLRVPSQTALQWISSKSCLLSTWKHPSLPLGGHTSQDPPFFRLYGQLMLNTNLRQKNIRISCLARWLAYPHRTNPHHQVFSGGLNVQKLPGDSREWPTKGREVRIRQRGPDCWRCGEKHNKEYIWRPGIWEYSRQRTHKRQQRKAPYAFHVMSHNDLFVKLHLSWRGVEWGFWDAFKLKPN